MPELSDTYTRGLILFCIAILSLRTFFWPRMANVSWLILDLLTLWTSKGILLWGQKSIWRLKSSRTSRMERKSIYGVWGCLFMKCWLEHCPNMKMRGWFYLGLCQDLQKMWLRDCFMLNQPSEWICKSLKITYGLLKAQLFHC